MRVLHLSDVHITSANAPVIAERVLGIVDAVTPWIPIDLLVFTGDATQAGALEQLQLFHKNVLEPLAMGLNLTPDRLVLVPGNHDVTRTRVDEILEVGLVQAAADPERADEVWRTHRERALQRLETFFGWAKQHGYQTESFVLAAPEGMIGVACLNSAWLSSGDRDRHRLAITRAQALAAHEVIDAADLKLAACHHPLDWMNDSDADRVRDVVLGRFSALLFGHHHQNGPALRTSPQGGALFLQAPAVYSRDYYNGFNVYDFELKEHNFILHPLVWDPRVGHFLSDLANMPDGKSWTAPLVKALDDQRVRALALRKCKQLDVHFLAMLERTIPGISAERPLGVQERWIEPQVAHVKTESSKPLSLRKIVGDKASYLFVGERHSGKTSLLAYLGHKFSQQGIIAALIPATEVPRTEGARGLEEALQLSLEESSTQARKLTRQPLVLLIDEDRASLDGEQWAAIASWIEISESLRIMVACSSAGLTAAGALSKQLKLVRISPLSVARIREEIARLSGYLSSSSQIHLEHSLETLIAAELPRWPWVLLMLLDVWLKGEGRDIASISRLLTIYVQTRLGSPGGTGEDARVRGRMLRLLADELMSRREARIARELALRVIRDEVERAGLSASAEAILDELIATRLVVEDGGRVLFSFFVLQEFFYASRLAEDQWRDFGPLGSDGFYRLAGSLAFLSEMANVPGLVQHAFGVARKAVPSGAAPLTSEDLRALDELLQSATRGDLSEEEAVSAAKAAAPDDDTLDETLARREKAASGSRLARVRRGQSDTQSVGRLLAHLLGAVHILKSTAWLDRAGKAELVREAAELAAIAVGGIIRDPDLIRLLQQNAPSTTRQASSTVAAIIMMAVGATITEAGAARHLALALRDAYESETDPVRRLVLLMWFAESDGDAIEGMVERWLEANPGGAELALFEVWVVVKYAFDLAYTRRDGGLWEKVLRAAVRERIRRASSSRTGASEIMGKVDQEVARLRQRKAVVERLAEDGTDGEPE